MSDKTFLALTAAAGAAFTVLTSAIAGWPWWVGVLVGAVVVLGGLAVKHGLEGAGRHEVAPQPVYQQVAPPPPPPSSTWVQDQTLPSSHPDYRFLLHGKVFWRRSPSAPADSHARGDRAAVDAIRERAARHTQDKPASDVDLLGSRLAADLSYPATDRSGELEVWAQDVGLTLPKADQERLDKLAYLRKETELWDHQRLHEQNKRAYLHDDVFTSPGSAVVWWLSRDDTKVKDAVGLIGTLAQLTAAANNREVDDVFRAFVDSPATAPPEMPATSLNGDPLEYVRRLIDQTLPDDADPERLLLADELATVFTNLGVDDLAHRIRATFGAPTFTEPVDADPSPNGSGDEWSGANGATPEEPPATDAQAPGSAPSGD